MTELLVGTRKGLFVPWTSPEPSGDRLGAVGSLSSTD